MITLLTIVHIFVSFFLVIVVLLQSGKAADLAGAFGGMGSQTAFGPRGSATVLSKATTTAAVLFMLTSLTLSILVTRSAG
jgi:preprotein translocase subunit SecG